MLQTKTSTLTINLVTSLLKAFIFSCLPLGHKTDERTVTGNLQSSQFCVTILKAVFVTALLFSSPPIPPPSASLVSFLGLKKAAVYGRS